MFEPYPLAMMGVVMLYLGLVALLAGAVALVLRWRLRWYLLGGGLTAGLAGVLLPASEREASAPRGHIDRFAPRWQFHEVHATRVSVACSLAYRATHQVTAAEIALFRTLTWIRRLGRPGPESLLDAPERIPLLEVATRSGFIWLADDRNREIVVGTVLRPPPNSRMPGTPGQFEAVSGPGSIKAVMNFRFTADGPDRCGITTETRVTATGASARRRFALYWRAIYPGSAIIRRMWLRAVKRRAEGAVSPSAPTR